MEVMEEGNLMDRVPILLQRDLQYYQEHQSVLQEPICPGVVGGKLDFPRYASFASIKIVIWWEEEFFAAYRKHSGLLHTEAEAGAEEDTSTLVVKDSDPDKFVGLVTKSADLLMAHLHILTQESLDHADLSVLTATIGAAALIKNCLKIYLSAATTIHYPPRGDEKGGSLKISYKEFSQMAEALAERLLDLHCRILLLYTIQDADCLYWEDDQPFFESERGSYTIQMWWHYMRGTKDDLWNSVPPKMAQRIFAGMLNETLSVLTVRYSHIVTSKARSQLHLVDICNLLLCISELLPHISESGEAYLGLKIKNQSIIIRDVHAKCRELFYCLLLRGAPLGVLSKVFRKGLENMEMCSSRDGSPSAWIVFVLSRLFPKDHSNRWVTEFSDLNADTAIALELKVLLGFPEADWSFLVKVILMRDAKLSSIILPHLIKHLPSSENFKNVAKWSFTESHSKEKCAAFMCRRECFNAADLITDEPDPVGQTNSQLVLALTYVLVAIGKSSDIKTCLISALEKAPPSWCECLNKHQVWNQKRPPWLEAIMYLVYPVLDCIVEMLINEVEIGASMYQAMELALTGVSEMWVCVPEGVYKAAVLLQDTVSVSTKPLGDSVLLQVVFSALYTELIKNAERYEKNQSDAKAAICYSLSEAICSIDEDDKHTEQIKSFLAEAKDHIMHFMNKGTLPSKAGSSGASTAKADEVNERRAFSPEASYLELDVGAANFIAELLASDILTENIGKQSLKVIYNYIKINQDWLFEQLNVKDIEPSDSQAIRGQKIAETKPSILRSMFFIGHTPFDQLLTGALKIDYSMWLQTPISLNPQRAWLQIARRTDFQPEEKLTPAEVTMVAGIAELFKEFKKDCAKADFDYWMQKDEPQQPEEVPEEDAPQQPEEVPQKDAPQQPEEVPQKS